MTGCTIGVFIDAVEPAMRRAYGPRLAALITALLIDLCAGRPAPEC